MKELYLEVFSDIAEDGTCFAPIETGICLFTIIYCNYPPILLTFILSSNVKKKGTIQISISDFIFELIDQSELEGVANACELPLIVTCEGTTVVAGLCAVLRQMIKHINPVHSLLGFKQSCLYACAESSVWTKFCEVDIIETADQLLTVKPECDIIEIPLSLARYEVHMAQPVRIHNIQKQKQDLNKTKNLMGPIKFSDQKLNPVQDLEHVYAEGPHMTLADVILFPSFHVIFENIGSSALRKFLPLSYKWYETVLKKKFIKDALKLFPETEKEIEKDLNVHYIFPQVADQSLYKGDIKKRQLSRKRFTKQKEIAECFQILEELKATIDMNTKTFGYEIDFDWTTVPLDFRSDDGQIPLKRLERKGQQLLNMTKAVLKIARNGDKIVDFCSGSGHLGLILAHALPRCFIVLVENKEQSLNRARERAAKLKLSNVVFCQSNIDYFKGHFNIGISLHACGVATDLVIEKCISEKASFVCCPCCYGSIQDNHMIRYPRSEVFRNSRITFKNYLVLGHSSDQTHYEENEKTDQGNLSMLAIDSDRCLRAKEAGYWVTLSKLDPPSCTPKNNLLVGIPMDDPRLIEDLLVDDIKNVVKLGFEIC